MNHKYVFNNSEEITFIDNTLLSEEFSNKTQIEIIGGQHHHFIENSIECLYAQENTFPNVKSSMSDGNGYDCNDILGGYQGIKYFGSNAATLLQGTSFDHCLESLVLSEAEIGHQNYRGNVWTGNGNVGVIEAMSGSDFDEIAQNSQFTYRASELPPVGSLTPPAYDPANIGDQWFIPEQFGHNQFCDPAGPPWEVNDQDVPNLCDPKGDPWWLKLDCEDLKNYLERSMFGSFQSIFKDQYLWHKQRYFYGQLLEHPELRDTCTYIDSIMQELPYKAIYPYVMTDHGIKYRRIPQETDCVDLRSILEQMKLLEVQIAEVDSLLVIDELNRVAELAQKSLLLQQLQVLGEQYKDIIKINESTVHRALLALNSQIDELVTTNIYESTYKRYWQLAIKVQLKGKESLGISEINELYAMSQLCPLEAGDAVYGARDLYSLYDGSLEYDDNSLCGISRTVVPRSLERKDENQGIHLFPNPSASVWTLGMTNQQEENIRVELTDIHGRLLESYDLGNAIQIKCSIGNDQLVPGIYIVKIYAGEELLESKQLIKSE